MLQYVKHPRTVSDGELKYVVVPRTRLLAGSLKQPRYSKFPTDWTMDCAETSDKLAAAARMEWRKCIF